MNLSLARFAYTPSEIQGLLRIDGWTCFTIERPWLRWSYPDGQPFESCIPDGEYELVPFIRPNGDKVFAMVNRANALRYQTNKRRSKRRLACMQ